MSVFLPTGTDKIGGNNGTLFGGTHHNDGPFVGAGYVEFDGTNDRINIPASSDFNFGTGDFTLSGSNIYLLLQVSI